MFIMTSFLAAFAPTQMPFSYLLSFLFQEGVSTSYVHILVLAWTSLRFCGKYMYDVFQNDISTTPIWLLNSYFMFCLPNTTAQILCVCWRAVVQCLDSSSNRLFVKKNGSVGFLVCWRDKQYMFCGMTAGGLIQECSLFKQEWELDFENWSKKAHTVEIRPTTGFIERGTSADKILTFLCAQLHVLHVCGPERSVECRELLVP